MKYELLILLHIITLSLTSLKIKIAGMSIEYIKNESDQKNIVQNNSKKCYTSFKIKHGLVFQNCIRYYKSNFKNVKFEEFLEMFMIAMRKSKIILDTYTKERFDSWSKEIVDWKPIMDIFMFLGVKFQNNFLFNAVYYMNKFEERPIRGNEFINYFKFNYIESVKKGITYLINECYKDTRETLYDLQKNKNSLNFSIFEKYLHGFEDDNKKIFEPREVDYLRKFRLPSSLRDKNTRTNMDYNIHLYLFESIFASSKSRNTLTLFPELLLYRIKFKESFTLKSIRDVHHLITFIIFKVESILLFLFKEEINLKKVMYIPKYVAIIIESVVLTGRCLILKNLKCQKSDCGKLKENYKYFEFLAYISFLKIGGVDLIAQNYSPKFSITLDFYNANEADLAALIN